MEFTYEELAILNKIISIALLSGKMEINEITQSIHSKVANEICRRVEQKEGLKEALQDFTALQ